MIDNVTDPPFGSTRGTSPSVVSLGNSGGGGGRGGVGVVVAVKATAAASNNDSTNQPQLVNDERNQSLLQQLLSEPP